MGLIEILRYSLIGLLLVLSGVWEFSVAIIKWSLVLLLWVFIAVAGMVGVLGLLVFGGPVGLGFLAAMALFGTAWCLDEDY